MHPVHNRCSSHSRHPLGAFQLDDKTLCREVRSQVNVEENAVFLFRVTLEAENFEFFNQASGTWILSRNLLICPRKSLSALLFQFSKARRLRKSINTLVTQSNTRTTE